MDANDEFWAPRRYLAEPISEIFQAADLLSAAVDAHTGGDRAQASKLILQADISAIGEWLDPIWVRNDQSIIRRRKIEGAPPVLPKDQRPKPRMPPTAIKRAVLERDGHYCRFCGLPVINPSAREFLFRNYREAIRWGTRATEQHTAFQALWLQFDHVLPNGRGGESILENIVVTCAACNFGRMERTLEEVGIIDPWKFSPRSGPWDGLNRVLLGTISGMKNSGDDFPGRTSIN